MNIPLNLVKLQALMAERDMSPSDLARAAKLSKGGISLMLKLGTCSIASARKLASAFDVSVDAIRQAERPATGAETVLWHTDAPRPSIQHHLAEAREVLESNHPVYTRALEQNIKAFALAVRSEKMHDVKHTHSKAG